MPKVKYYSHTRKKLFGIKNYSESNNYIGGSLGNKYFITNQF